MCKGIFARLQHDNSSKEAALGAQQRGWSWSRGLILRSTLQPSDLERLITKTFDGEYDAGLQSLGVTKDEINLTPDERLLIAEQEHQLALTYVNEFRQELADIRTMEAYVNNAARQVNEAISKIDGLGTDSGTESDHESDSEPNPESDPESEQEVINLCSQTSEETDESLLASPLPARKTKDHLQASSSSSGGTSDKLVPDLKDVERQLVELLGEESPLISQVDRLEEISRHRTLPATVQCIIQGGCARPLQKPHGMIVPYQTPEDQKTMMGDFYHALQNTKAPDKRNGHQRAIGGVSNIWDKAARETKKAARETKSIQVGTPSTQGENLDFFRADTDRLYSKKSPQVVPPHMVGKGELLTVAGAMAGNHRSPNTSSLGSAGHKDVGEFDPDEFEVGTDDHHELTVPQMKQILRKLDLPLGGNKSALQKRLDSYIEEEGLGQVRIRSEKKKSKRQKTTKKRLKTGKQRKQLKKIQRSF